jgi:hypothetical protein
MPSALLCVQAGDFLQCVNEQAGSDITRNLPADSDVPPAVNPILEQKARNSSVNTGISEINYEKVRYRDRARLRNKMFVFFLCAKGGISSVFGNFAVAKSFGIRLLLLQRA